MDNLPLCHPTSRPATLPPTDLLPCPACGPGLLHPHSGRPCPCLCRPPQATGDRSKYKGFTALMLAAQGGHLDIVQALIAKGASLDFQARCVEGAEGAACVAGMAAWDLGWGFLSGRSAEEAPATERGVTDESSQM